jgi:tetratricopeptide (TPR) repeat protein
MYERANTLLAVAFALEQQGKYTEALERYDEALLESIPPEAAGLVWYNKGNCYVELSQQRHPNAPEDGVNEEQPALRHRLAAEDAFFRALRSPPPRELIPSVLNNLTGLFFDSDRWHEALACADFATERLPRVPLLLATRAQALYNVDRYVDAAQAAEGALRLDPANGVARQTLERATQHVRRMQRMLLESEEKIRLDSANVEGWRRKMIALVNLGRVDEVFEVGRSALSVNPDWHQVYALKGAAWLAMGDLANARRDCDQALRIAPDDSTAHFVNMSATKVEEIRGKLQQCRF